MGNGLCLSCSLPGPRAEPEALDSGTRSTSRPRIAPASSSSGPSSGTSASIVLRLVLHRRNYSAGRSARSSSAARRGIVGLGLWLCCPEQARAFRGIDRNGKRRLALHRARRDAITAGAAASSAGSGWNRSVSRSCYIIFSIQPPHRRDRFLLPSSSPGAGASANCFLGMSTPACRGHDPIIAIVRPTGTYRRGA